MTVNSDSRPQQRMVTEDYIQGLHAEIRRGHLVFLAARRFAESLDQGVPTYLTEALAKYERGAS